MKNFKYHFLSFICFTTMLARIISSLDIINCINFSLHIENDKKQYKPDRPECVSECIEFGVKTVIYVMKQMEERTDQWTDGRTDRSSYRDTSTHLNHF